MKDSFVFRKEWKDALSGLPTDVKVEVYEAIIEYGTSGTEPENLKPLARLAFNFAKTTLDRDSERYEDIKKKRSEAGKLGNEKRWKQKDEVIANATLVSQTSQDIANVADNVYVDVNVNKLSNESVISAPAPAPAREGYDVNEIYLDKFFKTNIGQMEKLLMDFGMKPDDNKKLRDIAESIVNEWRISEETHNSYNDWSKHLMNTLRIKAKDEKLTAYSLPLTVNDENKRIAREEREKNTAELFRQRDEWEKKSVSLEEARNSEEYRKAFALS